MKGQYVWRIASCLVFSKTRIHTSTACTHPPLAGSVSSPPLAGSVSITLFTYLITPKQNLSYAFPVNKKKWQGTHKRFVDTIHKFILVHGTQLLCCLSRCRPDERGRLPTKLNTKKKQHAKQVWLFDTDYSKSNLWCYQITIRHWLISAGTKGMTKCLTLYTQELGVSLIPRH